MITRSSQGGAGRAGLAGNALPPVQSQWRDIADSSVRYALPRSIRIEGTGLIIELVVDPSLVHDQSPPGEQRDLLTLQWRLRGSGMLAQVGVVVADTDLADFVAAIDLLIAGKASEAILEGRETPSSVLKLQSAIGSAATLTMLASHAQLPGRFVLERLPLNDEELQLIRNWAKG